MRKNFYRFSAIYLVIFSFILLFSLQSQADDSKTFLWKIQSGKNIAYVLGSIHFMKKEYYPIDERIERAFEQSDILAVEANVNDLTGMNLQELMEAGFYLGDDSLEKHVSKETYELVKKETEKSGLPLIIIDRQKPWLLGLTMNSLKLAQFGFDPNYGIDLHFLLKAGKKKIKELESLDYQLNLFKKFSESEQELFLIYSLRDLDTLEKDVDTLVRAWQTGDMKTMETLITKSFREDKDLSPISDILIYERNRNMTAKIEEYLKADKIHFVIVGAGHLVGDRGIIEMLKGKGYTVQQL